MSPKPSAPAPVRATARSYAAWIADLKRRWRATQIKAAVAVNSELIRFNWDLGRDIAEKYPGETYGGKFFETLGADLQKAIPGANGFTKVNLIYCLNFYRLYAELPIVPRLVERFRGTKAKIVPQLVEQSGPESVRGRGQRVVDRPVLLQVAAGFDSSRHRPQLVDDKTLQQLVGELVLVPWGHHRTIIDKCKGDRDKALFYVRRTIRNGWSRSVLLNWLSTDLYEREGAAQTNFELTLPAADCDLARQLVRDPQVLKAKKLGLPMGVTDYQIKRLLPTQAQLAKCYADAEAQLAAGKKGAK